MWHHSRLQICDLWDKLDTAHRTILEENRAANDLRPVTFTFQQSNKSKHATYNGRVWPKHIQVLKRPSQSPNLNPFESVVYWHFNLSLKSLAKKNRQILVETYPNRLAGSNYSKCAFYKELWHISLYVSCTPLFCSFSHKTPVKHIKGYIK